MRLQRFYREREFLEARISARRTRAGATASGEGGMALEYEIDRGPETRLTIEGHSMPGDLIERMKDAWVWAVFDGFLLDDLTTLAREQLTREGYLRADIQATVVSEPDSAIKEIAIRVDPGTRYTSRQIVFSGQQAIPAAALDAAVRAQGVDASMWHEPAGLQDGNRAAVSTARISRSRRQGSGTGLHRGIRRAAGADHRGPAIHHCRTRRRRREIAHCRAGDRHVWRRRRIGVPAGSPRACSPRRRARLPPRRLQQRTGHRDHNS